MPSGQSLLQQARSKEAKKPKSIWKFIGVDDGSSEDYYSEVVSDYEEAGKAFRLERNEVEAAHAFEAAAEIAWSKCKDNFKSAQLRNNAAEAYERAQRPDDVRRALENLSNFTIETRLFTSMAKNTAKKLANIYQMEGNFPAALEQWERAATLSTGESEAAEFEMKAAEIAAISGDYQTAIGKFEKSAKFYSAKGAEKSSGMQYKITFHAPLCYKRAAICGFKTTKNREQYEALIQQYQADCLDREVAMFLMDICDEMWSFKASMPDLVTAKNNIAAKMNRLGDRHIQEWEAIILGRFRDEMQVSTESKGQAAYAPAGSGGQQQRMQEPEAPPKLESESWA